MGPTLAIKDNASRFQTRCRCRRVALGVEVGVVVGVRLLLMLPINLLTFGNWLCCCCAHCVATLGCRAAANDLPLSLSFLASHSLPPLFISLSPLCVSLSPLSHWFSPCCCRFTQKCAEAARFFIPFITRSGPLCFAFVVQFVIVVAAFRSPN